MKFSSEKINEALKLFIWPITLIVGLLLIRNTNVLSGKVSMKEFIDLLTVIVWPLTLVIGLILFKKHLSSVIGSLGSLKAGKDGIEMTFQNKIENVQQLLGAGSESGAVSKSSGQIRIKGSTAVTPYQELMEIRDALNARIISKAQKHNITTEHTTSIALSEKLKDVGAITIQNFRLFGALVDLTNSGNPSINQTQINQVKTLYNSLQL
ncbi:hypothetical protein A9Q87_08040 [Flavobacteriales bacterium 34_180_T64]|nr:hypothetical protein A9Q87_08040 [Flavobacteriales bacterium 34_180_T64]